VKDQLARIDSTYPEVDFHFVGIDGGKRTVTTVEEEEYPQFYHTKGGRGGEENEHMPLDSVVAPPVGARKAGATPILAADQAPAPSPVALAEGHFVYAENRKGVSYDKLFGSYLDGASLVVVTDPYIRLFYQIRNMMEFVEMLIRRKRPEDQMKVHLVTAADEGNVSRQRELLDSIVAACTGSGVEFSWAFDTSGTAHARDIVTDTGWKIVLDRGLDIFQPPIKTEGFSLGERLQEHRVIKGFYVTYVRVAAEKG
jgi:ATP-dependent Lon protease